MSYVLQEDLLMDESSLDTQMKFLQTHLDELAVFFDEAGYKKTKADLHEMELKVGRTLFPGWFS